MKLESWEWSKRSDFHPMSSAAATRRRETREREQQVPVPSIPGVPRTFSARGRHS